MPNRSLVTKQELWDAAKEGFLEEYGNRPMTQTEREARWVGYLKGTANGYNRAGAISLELLAAVNSYCDKHEEASNA